MEAQRQIEAAREQLRTGHYDRAIGTLSGCDEWPAPFAERGLLLRAEIAVRRDAVSALELLARVNDLFHSDEGRFGYYIASSKAYAQCRNFEAARDMLDAAAQLATRLDDDALAHVAYHRSRLRWLSQEFDPDSPDMRTAVGASDIGLRFEALAVRSWMHAGREDFVAQVRDLRASVDLAAAHLEHCDYRALGRTLHALLRLALELGDDEAVAAAERVFNEIAWTADLREEQFLSMRALAWHAFLRGESARAQWLFRDSKEIAPNDAWRVMAHVDRAYVARMARNDAWATDELYQAHAYARNVVWSNTFGEERQALVTLSILFANVDMALAQHYVSTYIRLGTESMDPSLTLVSDRRAQAYRQYASGHVQRVLGNGTLAARSFESAYRIFSEIGYHFRAALAAEALAGLTSQDHWQERAREHAAYFPHSKLSEGHRHEPRQAAGGLAQLSPLHQRLALALAEGLDTAELSRRFSRSEFTIRREADAVMRQLNVHSRHELRALLDRDSQA